MEDTLPRMVLQQAQRLRGRTALQAKEGGAYRDISWEALEEKVRTLAKGFLALGLRRGERVAIMSPNCPEWAYADLAIMACGGISVPVYHTEGLATITYLVNHAGSRYLALHSPVVGQDLLAALDAMPSLEKIILLEGHLSHPLILTVSELMTGATGMGDDRLEQELAQGQGDDVATLVYTSGTTGQPKGAMLTHRNILANIQAVAALFDIGPEDRCLSFLPLSHVFERMAGYYFMLSRGAVIAYAENVDSVPANLMEVRPTLVISVPRLYEKLYARIMARVLSGSWLSKQVFFGALRAGQAAATQRLSGIEPNAALRLALALAERLVFAKLKAPLGGRLRFFVSGGAPLSKDIAEFFLAAGIPIYEGYGLTETSPVLAANAPGAHRPGTVGHPLQGIDIRIADDGEILARGPSIFKGYWEDPEKTAEVFRDGWFQTGDIGQFDPDGFLTITDRKKDLIVTAGGENIAPQNLEILFKKNKYLANAMVYGDRKPFLSALLVPNFDNLEKFAKEHHIDFLNHCDLVNHPRILELIRTQIDQLQEGKPSFQRIKRFTLLSRDFSGEQVTPTLKIKRKVVRQHLHHVLEGMYQPQGHGIHDSGFCVVEEPSA